MMRAAFLNRTSVFLAAIVLTLPAGMAQKSAKQPSAKAMDYILAHMKRLEENTLAADFFVGVGRPAKPYTVLGFTRLERVDSCTVIAHFSQITLLSEADGKVEGHAVAVTHVRADLRTAELGGVTSREKTVELRFLKPVPVTNEALYNESGSSKEPTFTNWKAEWLKLPLPASDNEGAVRLGRAFEELIQSCGGKRDPFAR